MTRSEFIKKLKNANLPPTEYVVTAGGSLLLHGIRTETQDIDLACTAKLAQNLISQGFAESVRYGTRRIEISEDFEVYENDSLPDFVIIDDIPAMTLDEVVAMKKRMGREKDLRDLELIENFLNK